MKNFRIWLEEKLAIRDLKHRLLDALYLSKDALDNGGDVPLRTLNRDRLLEVISSMGLSQEGVDTLTNYARSNWKGGTLNAMFATLNPQDIEQQDTDSSSPAVLPNAQQPMPKPINRQQIEIKSKSLLNNIEKWQQKRLPDTDIHLYLFNFLKQIEIKHDEASVCVNSMPVNEYNVSKIAIDKFLNKEYYMYADDYGRIHTNVTTLKSTLRKYLLYKNKPLFNVDIINSQPLLLLLTNPFINTIRCAFSPYFDNGEMDIFNYKQLVENGKLYDYMMEYSGEDSRQEFKEKFFRETFFGKRISKLFVELFPTVASKLAEIKKDDYRTLAWLMQRAESNLIINHICRRLMLEHRGVFIATIHDSILTTEENVNKIQVVILEEFGKFNLSPSLRVESA